MGQYNVLMRLFHTERCGVGDVGSQLGITTAAASQLVDKLVQQGWVERAEDPDDRRVKRLTLSRTGRELVELGLEARLKWTAGLPEVLPADRAQAVMDSLEDLIAAAEKLNQPSPF
jgi:DNA-binding MarR family transcriptional regulator